MPARAKRGRGDGDGGGGGERGRGAARIAGRAAVATTRRVQLVTPARRLGRPRIGGDMSPSDGRGSAKRDVDVGEIGEADLLELVAHEFAVEEADVVHASRERTVESFGGVADRFREAGEVGAR